MKTLITVPANNFQSYTANVNSNDELEITGSDGNGVAFQQTLAVGPNSIIVFDPASQNFQALQVQGEITPNQQLVAVVRDLV